MILHSVKMSMIEAGQGAVGATLDAATVAGILARAPADAGKNWYFVAARNAAVSKIRARDAAFRMAMDAAHAEAALMRQIEEAHDEALAADVLMRTLDILIRYDDKRDSAPAVHAGMHLIRAAARGNVDAYLAGIEGLTTVNVYQRRSRARRYIIGHLLPDEVALLNSLVFCKSVG